MSIIWKNSLRLRLVGPLIMAAAFCALLVAALSFYLGRRRAYDDVNVRFAAIRENLKDSTFPLSENVVQLLAGLTGAELLTVTDDGLVEESSLSIAPDSWRNLQAILRRPTLRSLNVHSSRARVEVGEPHQIVLNEREYLLFRCERKAAIQQGNEAFILVLFDLQDINAAGNRAAVFPLLTGLSTIVALVTVLILLADRIASRLKGLQQRVGLIAAGDFDVRCNETRNDEIGQLGETVDSMAAQLKNLWKELDRQQRSKLLHQIASGMAHQLRNTLTGSKMAMELHAKDIDDHQNEDIKVALGQLEIAEEYVRRLLMVGQQQAELRPACLSQCLDDLQLSLSVVAQHLNKELDWQVRGLPPNLWVEDGPSFISAVSNLVLNAIEAGSVVTVQTTVDGSSTQHSFNVSILVIDNGPGIHAAVEHELFEPFVTTKPEGIGLGLPTVQRAAQQLHGSVSLHRDQAKTTFRFTCVCRVKDIEVHTNT